MWVIRFTIGLGAGQSGRSPERISGDLTNRPQRSIKDLRPGLLPPGLRGVRVRAFGYILLIVLLAAGLGPALPPLQAMLNHHEYHPHGWRVPLLYGARKAADEMVDFDPRIPGAETRRELFILPDDAGRVYRLSYNKRVFCYVFDHDLLDPWDFELADYDGSGGFEIKQPPFTDFFLPRWTFADNHFPGIGGLQTAAPATGGPPSVQALTAALSPQAAPAPPGCAPERLRALTIARGGTPPPPDICRPPAQPEEAPRVALDILFELNQAEPSGQSFQTLNNLGQALISEELAGSRFRLEGHTDARGDSNYNMELSRRRAYAVQRYLQNALNIPSSRLTAVGLGASRPLPGLAPEDGRNRRVEVINLSGETFPAD